jgi:hypothetical protein
VIYYIRKRNYFIGDTRKIQENIIIVNFIITGSLVKWQFSLTDLTLLSEHRRGSENPINQILETCMLSTKHSSYTIHLYINGTDVVELVEVAEVLAKRLQSARNTTVGCHSGLLSIDYLAVASHFRIRHFESYDTPQTL